MDLEYECITWTGTTQKNNGYGRLKVNGEMKMVHRWVFEMQYGPIPDGLTIDHICFNRACIEPTHLRPMTRQENGARHQDDCKCSRHAPVRLSTCVNGHDLTQDGALVFPPSRPRGRCRQCMADADKRRQGKNKLLRDGAIATAA